MTKRNFVITETVVYVYPVDITGGYPDGTDEGIEEQVEEAWTNESNPETYFDSVTDRTIVEDTEGRLA